MADEESSLVDKVIEISNLELFTGLKKVIDYIDNTASVTNYTQKPY
jgi:hypothetical protein